MPQGDRRGPNGNGPLTGRGLGFCNGNETAGYLSMERGGRGAGYGRGRGFGNQHRYGGRGFNSYRMGGYTQSDFVEVNEKTLIENEINILKDQLTALEERLKNIKE
jgi:hypothetical protein